MLRILHVILSLDPKQGGPPEAVRAMSMSLVENGHEVEVVSLDDPAAAYLAEFPVPVRALGPVRSVSLLSTRYAYTPRLAAWIKAQRTDYDVAIIHGLWSHA